MLVVTADGCKQQGSGNALGNAVGKCIAGWLQIVNLVGVTGCPIHVRVHHCLPVGAHQVVDGAGKGAEILQIEV